MITALIMAGGKGTRFWPLSTEDKPKQFLNLVGDSTMIQMTVNRIIPIIPIERIFICTCEKYIDLVKEQLPELPERNIIIEPEGMNTAPCITLSALVIKRYYKDATMVVLPADHLIANENEFREIVKDSNEFLELNKQAIVTLGMSPSRPETGYGYIKFGNDINSINGRDFVKVEAFVEKPNREKAEEYLKEKTYLWNGGMFMWKISTILEQLKEYASSTYEVLHNIEHVSEENLQDLINEQYMKTEAISIDYAVLEKSEDIYVVPSNIKWDDIGSWNAIERYREKDSSSNISMGDSISFDSKNNIIISAEKKIIINEVSDIFVIETEDNIIVGRKDNIDKLKEIKEKVGL